MKEVGRHLVHWKLIFQRYQYHTFCKNKWNTRPIVAHFQYISSGTEAKHKNTLAKNKTRKLTDIFRKIEQRQYITMTLVKSSTISNERKSRWQEIGVCYTMEIDFRAHIGLSFSHMTQKNEKPSAEGKKAWFILSKRCQLLLRTVL